MIYPLPTIFKTDLGFWEGQLAEETACVSLAASLDLLCAITSTFTIDLDRKNDPSAFWLDWIKKISFTCLL